jgi:hypothetical protein
MCVIAARLKVYCPRALLCQKNDDDKAIALYYCSKGMYIVCACVH